MTMNDLCAHLFRDYQFGLSLIKKNTGRTTFVIDAGAVDAPDKFFSELVVHSYYPAAVAQKTLIVHEAITVHDADNWRFCCGTRQRLACNGIASRS